MLLLWTALAWGAQCTCESELTFALAQLERTPSFREQIRGARRASFDRAIETLRAEMTADPRLSLHCRAYLQRAFAQVRDRHLGVKGTKDDPRPLTPRRSLAHELALDELEATLGDASPSAIEGLYSHGRTQLGVYAPEPGRLVGVLLSTPADGWSRGDVVLDLTERDTFVDGLVYGREAIYMKAASIDRLLSRLPYEKQGAPTSAYRAPGDTGFFRVLRPGVGHLFVPSFKGTTENLAQVRPLYAEVAPQLAGLSHLIVDVRDNGGGGQVAYVPLLKALKGTSLDVHVLVNRRTASAAEHFALRLKRRFDATLYGENSVGAIRYRFTNRPSAQVTTPCFAYRLSLTVAKVRGPTSDPDLEFVGITPDVGLTQDRDWVEQVLARIGERP